MLSRREFVGRGFAALAAARAFPALAGAGGVSIGRGHPILPIRPGLVPTVIGGLPFAPSWFGDVFPGGGLPFHQCESCEPDPPVTEEVDIAIVGGGLAGLACAWLLRDRAPVLFDLRPRFGGNAMGESWRGTPYSLASAYFIVPDKGSRLEGLYRALGVFDRARVDTGPLTFAWRDRVTADPCIEGCDARERAGVAAYRERVLHFAEKAYPEIPLPTRGAEWIRELDLISLEEDLDTHCPGMPFALRAAVQAYCYSSFGVGFAQISAASGWNFLAAEEYGRVVLPGGNAGFAALLFEGIAAQPAATGGRPALRPGCLVERVRLEGDRVVVRWRDASGVRHALRARHVVMANAKQIVERMIDDLDALDPEKAEALPRIETSAYAMANILMRRPVAMPSYDAFLVQDDGFPMDDAASSTDRRIADLLDGAYAERPTDRHVLTCYWPLPFASGRFTMVQPEQWRDYAELGAPQIRRALALVGADPADIVEIRLARFGHAMPIAAPGRIADGTAELVRRPIADRIWFANQDNWLLPAVEVCLEEAFTVADGIRAVG